MVKLFTPFRPLRPVLLAVACAAALGGAPQAVLAKSATPSANVAWVVASNESDVDKAFARAKSEGKPLFLYWGAVWCPPCNQVKATLFSRPDFADAARAFIPVFVDGDKPGAQKVASRYSVGGYPTMVLFKPDGQELNRLPGEADPERYLTTLRDSIASAVPIKELLTQAKDKAKSAALSAAQWRLLASYSWDTDDGQLVPAADASQLLAQLASHASAPDARDRLSLKALLMSLGPKATKPDAAALDALKQQARAVLADAARTRATADIWGAAPAELAESLGTSPVGGKATLAAIDQHLANWLSGKTPDGGRAFSKVEQADLWDARAKLWMAMAEQDNPGSKALSATQKDQVKASLTALVAATTDKYERQALVPGVASTLTQVGFMPESDKLLTDELPVAVSPNYHMLGLASNAKKRNDPKAAADWYEKAWAASQGLATRLQWGNTYLSNLMALTPTDTARIDKGYTRLLSDINGQPSVFYKRNQRSLVVLSEKTRAWAKGDKARQQLTTKWAKQLNGVCNSVKKDAANHAACTAIQLG